MAHSDFNYLTAAEYAARDISVSGITNEALALRHISAAERLIDAYVGPWDRFYPDWTGDVVTGTVSGITSSIFGSGRPPDYWAVGGVYIQFYEGSMPAGERRLIVTSSGDTVTVGSDFSQAPQPGDKFSVRQVSRFPRFPQDWFPTQRRPYLPDALKEAVAAQVSYMVQRGSEAFGQWDEDVVADAQAGIASETYGTGYSVSRDLRAAGTGSAAGRLLSPAARMHLKGLVNSLGRSGRGYSSGGGV